MYLSNLRRDRRRGHPIAVDSLADDLALSAPAQDRGEIRDFVRAMESLSEDHRQILLLVGLEGLSYREIAELLEVPIGTVMSRLARARERLRLALEGGDDQALRRVR
jgi:RNA polymerase sigma-70 factor (ECF subfamily)